MNKEMVWLRNGKNHESAGQKESLDVVSTLIQVLHFIGQKTKTKMSQGMLGDT